ncbi:Zip-domain-containing protein [Aulographum hederae CBS 113979]|uniref:Zip-domain-containing protein n=1 Tax=Aulographum hederae CBS 113979 TaxID=1176131 RepID=A0A6G1HAE6_9PEZI|nr:Zip-domain-containing protein [Aulographum hederae CBS 113979]
MRHFSSIVAIGLLGRCVAAQCHSEGDKEYCIKGSSTSIRQNPDCHTVGNEVVCYGGSGPTATVATLESVPALTPVPTEAVATAPNPAPTPVQSPESPDNGEEPHDEPASGEDMHGEEGEDMHGEEEEEHGLEDEGDAAAEPAEEEDDGHGHGGPKAGAALSCASDESETYTLSLRIAAIFVILTTSSIGVLAPIILRKRNLISNDGLVMIAFKQFGTGVIISTVFIHLLMHAAIEFANPCIGELEYEGTVMAIAMGGAFLSFLVDFAGAQYLRRRYENHGARVDEERHRRDGLPENPFDEKNAAIVDQIDGSRVLQNRFGRPNENELFDAKKKAIEEEKLSVMIMEGGIIFHSILVGVLLTVAPDKQLPTLFAVVLIHQMFEGMALGSKISPLDCIPFGRKVLMGFAFSCTAPIGMAIGIGVRQTFNSNDKSTIITLGSMDALSAGVLAWVAFVELWSKDWLDGEMKDAPVRKQVVGMSMLVLGIVIMSILGKWA